MKKLKKFTASIVLLLVLCPKTAFAETNMNRIFGHNRYETSVEISKNGWGQSDNIIIATGENFPDALCSAPLAYKLKAPIILTEKSGLKDKSLTEIKRLNVKNAYIIGGKGVINEEVQNQLENMDIKCKRIFGSNRYDTSLQIAKELGPIKEIAVVTGNNYPDALSVAPVAAKLQMPILLTDGKNIDSSFKSFINSNSIKKSYIIGGKTLISDNIASQLKNPLRTYGSNRYKTSIQIINNLPSMDFKKIYVATGKSFPDALAGAALAAKQNSNILLMDNSIDNESKQYINSYINYRNDITLLGGQSVVSDSCANLIKYSSNNSQTNTTPVVINNENDVYNLVKYTYINHKKNVSFISSNPNLYHSSNDYGKILDIGNKVVRDYSDYVDYLQIKGVSYIPSTATVSIKTTFFLSDAELENKRKLRDEKAKQIINSIIKPGMTDLEKETVIHDYIVNHTKYDIGALMAGVRPPDDSSSYGALINGTAMCEGYARSMQHLLRLAGIESYFVSGDANGTGHAWNIVKIDGKFYHVDATFDDPVANGGTIDVLSHDYFNLTDDEISKNHKWQKSDYPACK